MALWCKDIPTDTPTSRDTAKPFTLVVPYYENRAFFGQQLRHWCALPANMVKQLRVIVVDDGSPQYHAESAFYEVFGSGRCDFLRLFRIEVDIRWNWLAARNIGAHHAQTDWLLLTDMDHVLPKDTLHALLYGEHDPDCVYFFNRVEYTGQPATPHSASFFIHKDTFWKKFKGYDETLSGYYGTDGDCRRRLAQVAQLRMLPNHLVRYEYQGDSSTTRYKRKQPEDAAVKKLIAKRKPGWTPKTLSFPYREVQL